MTSQPSRGDTVAIIAKAEAALEQAFGPLEWSEANRGPKLCKDDGAPVISAAALESSEVEPAFGVWVEGEILDVFDGRQRWFFNFGQDYREDFTLSLQGEALSMVRRYWPKPTQWQGRKVRVRGFADFWNGWLIEWDYPGQVCFVGGVPYRG